MTRLFCGFDSLGLSQGGIARVGRLICRSLIDPESGAMPPADILVFQDLSEPFELPLNVRTVSRSKWRFLTAAASASVCHSHFLYGFLGIARSHGWLPWPCRPFACFIHGVEAWPGIWARADRVAVARRATALFANSAHTRDRATQLDPTFERAEVCWLATEEDNPPAAEPTPPGPPRVLIIGRIDEGYKGHRELIECWPRVNAAVPDAMLTIVGRGPRLEEYKALAAASPVANRIEFRGFVPDDELDQLWRQTSVFAMPSRGEGFGLVYIEAMRYGIPVIASVHDAGREVNADGVTGYNVDLDRIDELPDRLIQLLRSPDLAATLGKHGQQRWAAHFRYSAFRDRFVPILKQFLAQT